MIPEAPPDPFDLSRLCRYFSEHSPQPTVVVGGPGHVVRYLNPAFARLAGGTVNELLGRPFAEAVPERVGNGCLAAFDRVFRTGVPENLAEQEHGPSAAAYWTYAMWPVLGADDVPTGVMVQVTEATEVADFRRRSAAMNEALVVSAVRQHELIDAIRQGERERHELDRQLFQAQKLESLGVLAGGIAHDLNNMLTPVLGYAELAADALPEGSPAAPLLVEVMKNGRRAADLVRQILAYAGKGRFVVGPVDLSALVRELDVLLGAVAQPGTVLRYDLAPSLPLVEADATQLRQVVVNLVTNAAEAVGAGGGTVAVRTGVVAADPPAVFLEVTDTGAGMTAAVMETIFDPFFTTKFTGRGLGLAVVQGIARGHRGTVRVHSVPGRGSTFRLVLPSTPTPAPAPPAPPRPGGWRGTGTVLVIDDERVVGTIASLVLGGAGLTVVVAGGGEEGVALVRARPGGIDAVVLDLTMPGMGGLETAAALRAVRPDLPIVLMSGYTVEDVTLQSAGLGITGFVQKPFDKLALLAAVRHALGQ